MTEKPQNTKTERYLCIHGHFYQPPRENPWLETIEYQESAKPYHDWNERVTRECYGPNTRARILGEKGKILRIVNNYTYMSFNFGPTLLSWMEQNHPWIYSQILAADQMSQVRYMGHGNALAQVFNHIIMPFASSRDKQTQIRWGLNDFKHRFGRDAEGMWLAETAVDTETLDLMAQEGIRFTILSPTQAQAVRPLADQKMSWQDVSGGRIDPSRPYRVVLDEDNQRFIDIFFYDGPLSRAIAYEKILTSGADLLARINTIFQNYHNGLKLISIATDGESYGHHFKFGEMALSWLFHHAEKGNDIQLTNFGLFLEMFPPKDQVKIVENSSWSCAHGVERWRADCGCSIAQNPKWNQAWRRPLRESLNELADELAKIFKVQAGPLLTDCWEARDHYIHAILDHSELSKDRFLEPFLKRPLNNQEKIDALQLLESQRMALYMFTSCGWFFDDISGIEVVQVLMYALRAIELVQSCSEKDLESALLETLKQAKSNKPSYGNGAKVYHDLVKPAQIDASFAIANYTLTSMVKEIQEKTCPFSKMVFIEEQHAIENQDLYAKIGRAKVVTQRTGYETKRIYLTIRREKKDFYCLVGDAFQAIDLHQITNEIRSTLPESSKDDIKNLLSQYVSDIREFVIKDLITDVRQCILHELAQTIDNRFNESLQSHDMLIQEFYELLQETGDQLPIISNHVFHHFFKIKLNHLMRLDQTERSTEWEDFFNLVYVFGSIVSNVPIKKLKKRQDWRFLFLNSNIIQKAQEFLHFQMDSLAKSQNILCIHNVIQLVKLIKKVNIPVDLWECQNIFYDLYQDNQFITSLDQETMTMFYELGKMLNFIITEK